MELQPGLETAEPRSPLDSEEAVLLSTTVAAKRRAGRLYFYNASGVPYSCPEEDEEQVRLGAAILLTYRKGTYEPWPEDHFAARLVEVAGRADNLRLAEGTLELSGGFEVREVRSLDKRANQVSIVTTRRDLSIQEVASRMSGRWRQENFLRYIGHELALDHLPTYAVEPADPERPVPNPALKAKRQELRTLKTRLARAREAVGAGKPHSVMEDLTREVTDLEFAITVAKDEAGALPKKVPLCDLMDEKEIVQLETEQERITDAIKMAAYRAESELAALVGPMLGLQHQDEARTFLEHVFSLSADLLPDEDAGILRIRLYGMANPRSTRALAQLCRILNDESGYQTRFPGTRLRLVFEPPPVADQSC